MSTTPTPLELLSGLSPEQIQAVVALAGKLQQNDATSAVSKPEPKPRKRRTQVKYFTEQEIEALFRVIESPRDKAMFMVAYKRGLRASEVGMLQVTDWDSKSERLNVTRLKGSRGGMYRVSAAELRALRAWFKIRGMEPGPIFQSRERKPISQQRLDQLIKFYGAKANLPREKCHFHSLKHSIATHMINRGDLDISDVQDHLGHVNPASTAVYASFGDKRREIRDKRLRDW
jgi:integrase